MFKVTVCIQSIKAIKSDKYIQNHNFYIGSVQTFSHSFIKYTTICSKLSKKNKITACCQNVALPYAVALFFSTTGGK